MRNSALIALAAAALAGGPALAQSSDQDVRCLLASNLFAKTDKDPGRRQVATVSAFFYLGRLDGKLSPAQLKAQMLAQGKALTAANAGPVMTACARRVKEKGVAIQEIGNTIKSTGGK